MSQAYGDNPYYGGGGFMASPSQSSPGGTQRRSQKETLRPAVTSQLAQASQVHTDADWTINNIDIGAVTLVGQAITVNAQATNTTYNVDDGYGRIEARHWKDTSLEEGEGGGIAENDYVRVTGQLKSFNNRRYINATHVKKVNDWHEVYYHLLEVMTVTRTLEHGPPGGIQPQQRNGDASAYTAQSTTVSTDQFDHLPPLERQIVTFILNQPTHDEGIHVAAIARSVGSGGNAQAISQALDRLMDDGHVYTTIDESHFAVSQ